VKYSYAISAFSPAPTITMGLASTSTAEPYQRGGWP
jgi:hypothetical protein